MARNLTRQRPPAPNLVFVSAFQPGREFRPIRNLISFRLAIFPSAQMRLQINASTLTAGTVTNQAYALPVAVDSVPLNNLATLVLTIDNTHVDADNGNWSDYSETLTNTSGPSDAALRRY